MLSSEYEHAMIEHMEFIRTIIEREDHEFHWHLEENWCEFMNHLN